MLEWFMGLLGDGIGTLGAILLVWGIVQAALALSSSHGQAAGADLAPGIACTVGGAIIVGAALYFGAIDISWAN